MIITVIRKKVIAILALFIAAGCFSESDDETDDEPPTTNTANPTAGGNGGITTSTGGGTGPTPAAYSAIRVPLLRPPVDAKTPKALKANSLSLSETEPCAPADYPGQNPDDPDTDISKCKALQTVKGRFFQSGPTTLSTILSGVDGRIAEFFSEPNAYIPCLDPTNTGTDYDAFVETSYDFEATFPDGSTFDSGFRYHLNCIREISETSWVGIGKKDGVTYLYDGSTSNSGGAILASVDENRNVEMWYVVKGLDPDFNTETGTEKLGPSSIEDQVDLTYGGSTGIVHLKADATTNTLELTATGEGLGDGCGMHLQTNGDYLYYKANRNFYGRCYGDDYTDHGAEKYSDDGTALSEQNSADVGYRAGFDAREYCFAVSGDEPVPAALSVCTDVGLGNRQVLDDSDETGATTSLESSLELTPLVRYNADDTTNLGILAFNAVHLLNTEPVGLPEFVSVLPVDVSAVTIADALDDAVEDSNVDLGDVVPNELFFLRDSAATTNGWSSGFCKDEGTDVESFTIEYDLDLSGLTATQDADIAASPAIVVLFNVNNALGEREDDLRWSRFTDADLRLRGDGTFLAGITDQTVSSEDHDADATADGIQEFSVDLSELDLGTLDTLTIQFTGSQNFNCSADAPRLWSAAVRPSIGNARLLYFTEESRQVEDSTDSDSSN